MRVLSVVAGGCLLFGLILASIVWWHPDAEQRLGSRAERQGELVLIAYLGLCLIAVAQVFTIVNAATALLLG